MSVPKATEHGQSASERHWEPSIAPLLAMFGKPTRVTLSTNLFDELVEEFRLFAEPIPGIDRTDFEGDLRFTAAMYEMALSFYEIPSSASIRDNHRRLGEACKFPISAVERLAPSFKDRLNEELYAETKVALEKHSDFPQVPSLIGGLQGYCPVL
jgi:hypothetical protein